MGPNLSLLYINVFNDNDIDNIAIDVYDTTLYSK